MPKLSRHAMDILITCATLSSWYVSEDNIVHVGKLIECGFITASNDYDIIALYITDAGRKYLLRKKLIKEDATALFSPFSRTDAGDVYRT